MVANRRRSVVRGIVVFVLFAAPAALFAQTEDESAAQSGGVSVGGVFALVEGDAVAGSYASFRLPFGKTGGAWGFDGEALYELSGDPIDAADLAIAGQVGLDWSIRRFLELPDRVELRAGARGGVSIEVDRTEVQESGGGTLIDQSIEPYPTAGVYLIGLWPLGSRVALESRVTVDPVAAPRLGLNVGLRFR